MLTRKQSDLLLYIHDTLAETGISPSFEEMKNALDLKSKSGVHRLIEALVERGFIRRLPNRARALEVVKIPERDGKTRKVSTNNDINLVPKPGPRRFSPPRPANDVVEIPLHGKIAAGLPIEAIEGQSMLPVPAALLGIGEHYALEVSGDSMVEAGILDGDYALIRKTDSARDGEIIVALIEENNEATLKYFRSEGKMVRLDPANSEYKPQRFRPNEVRVQGRLAGLLRRY
jgi:repressor LexA